MASRLPVKVQPLTQAILSPVDVGRGAESAYGALADAANSIAAQLQPAVDAEAAAAGAASVKTGPDGKIEVGQKLNINSATAAYNNAAEASYLTQIAPKVRAEVARVSDASGFDVEKFNASAAGLAKGFLEGAPPQLAASIQTLVSRETASEANALVERKRGRDQKMAQGSVLAELGSLENKLSAYAGQDALATPEAKATLQDYRNLLDTQVKNPLFAVSPEMADAQFQNLQSKLLATTASVKAVKVFEAHGLEAAKSFIKETVYDPALQLSENERAHYENEAEAAIRQRQADIRSARAEAQAGLTDLIGDAEAMALRTGEWRGQVNENQIVNAFGAERGGRIVRDLDFKASVFRFGKELATATPDEIAATLRELQPEGSGPKQASAVKVGAASTGPDAGQGAESFGFKRDIARYDAAVSAVLERNKQIAADPAGYAVTNSPRLQDAWSGASTPDAVQRAAQATIDEQKRLGVPGDRIAPLPVSQASALVSDYISTEQPQDRARMIGDLAGQYGPLWPRVQQQLVKAGMPAGTEVLGAMTRPGQEVPRASLAEAMAAGPEKLKTLVGKGVEDVNKALIDEMAAFERTLALQPGGAAVAAQFHASAQTLALKYASEGVDAKAAARRAAADVANGQYAFTDTYRVPANFSAASVEHAADYVLSNLDKYDIAPVRSLDPRITPDMATNLYREAVSKGGYFVTNEDETGLLLLDPQGRPVVLKSGHDVEFSFDDLAKTGIDVSPLAIGGAPNAVFQPPKIRGTK